MNLHFATTLQFVTHYAPTHLTEILFFCFYRFPFQAPEAATMDTANDAIYIRLIRKFIAQLKSPGQLKLSRLTSTKKFRLFVQSAKASDAVNKPTPP